VRLKAVINAPMNIPRFGVEPDGRLKRARNLQTVFILASVLWVIASTSLAVIASWHNRVMRAELGMASGLILLWVVLGGGLMYILRDRIKAFLEPLSANWRISFFLLATAMAMCEEVVTTSLTNCAPFFGVKLGEAYITASSNYFDVIACHSVVTFLPPFAVWTWLYSRYHFSPFGAFVSFGVYGFLGETIYGGFHPGQAPFWILVYGLMIYLPAYVFADHRGRRRVSWLQYVMGAVGPFIGTIPWVLLLKLTVLRNHPDVHFPPIHTG
jgi:hypothetical protein